MKRISSCLAHLILANRVAAADHSGRSTLQHSQVVDPEYAIVKQAYGVKLATIVHDLACKGFTRTRSRGVELDTFHFPLAAISFMWANQAKWSNHGYGEFPSDDATVRRFSRNREEFLEAWRRARIAEMATKIMPQISVPSHYQQVLAPYQKGCIEHVNLWRDPSVTYYNKMPHLFVHGPPNSGKSDFMEYVILKQYEPCQVSVFTSS